MYKSLWESRYISISATSPRWSPALKRLTRAQCDWPAKASSPRALHCTMRTLNWEISFPSQYELWSCVLQCTKHYSKYVDHLQYAIYIQLQLRKTVQASRTVCHHSSSFPHLELKMCQDNFTPELASPPRTDVPPFTPLALAKSPPASFLAPHRHAMPTGEAELVYRNSAHFSRTGSLTLFEASRLSQAHNRLIFRHQTGGVLFVEQFTYNIQRFSQGC